MIYDLIIIGAGPAALTASIYASRYKLRHIVVGEIPGGLISEAHSVCNFPGANQVSGLDLMDGFLKHVQDLEAEVLLMEKVVKIKKEAKLFQLSTLSGKTLTAKTVLLATGTKHKKLGLKEESKYLGRGLAYCATCDAMFFKEKTVGVVGSGNSALTAALYLAEVAKKVYLILRGASCKGELAWVDQVKENNKIEILFNSAVSSLMGEDSLESIEIEDTLETKNKKIMDLDGLFVEIGTEPDPLLINQLDLKLDQGYVAVDQEQRTSLESLWAAGDITNGSNSFRQVITACSEGAVAVYSIFTHLQKNRD